MQKSSTYTSVRLICVLNQPVIQHCCIDLSDWSNRVWNIYDGESRLYHFRILLFDFDVDLDIHASSLRIEAEIMPNVLLALFFIESTFFYASHFTTHAWFVKRL